MEKATKPFGYWRKRENQVHFLEEFAKKYGIKKQQDWGNVRLPSIKKHGGGALLRIYRNNLRRTLERVYPRTLTFLVLQLKTKLGTLNGLQKEGKK